MVTLLFCAILMVLATPTEGAKNYGDALAKSILFYEAQRSGKLPADNRIPWRGDSALNDCVPGGWYDAGDHVKFGLPLSATVTLLGWSLVRFKDGYEKAGQLDEMYYTMKWGYDYLLGTWAPSKQQLVVQIGDITADHNYWGRPEDMTMDRPCLVANATNPASDIAGGTTAALAVGSIAFDIKGDTTYATQLLDAAKSLYQFGKTYRGLNTYGYATSDDKDELCEGAMWLYKATNDSQYLNDAKVFGANPDNKALGWESKTASCQFLLYEATNDDQYKQAVVAYFDDWFPGGSVDYTPCGMAWRTKWGSCRWAANSAFFALIAAEEGFQPDKYRQWAVEQINFILGDNNQDGGCFSFEIGYGSKYPLSPHHRAASCPDFSVPCDHSHLNASTPSPHLLVGGLVGGPTETGYYFDSRNDYVLNEVALDYNSGFQGALAGILHLEVTNQMPVTHNKCPCNQ